MNLDDVLNTFIVESRELLQQMEEALLRIEQSHGDADSINAIFRAAHTIKGSAGLFGLDHIVSFTHVAESVLDRVRNAELAFAPDLTALLLEVCDHIGEMIDHVAQSRTLNDAVIHTGDELSARLKTYLRPNKAPVKCNEMPVEHERPFETGGGGRVETDNWHISLRFGPDCLRNGMDPAAFIHYLGSLGRIVSLVTLTDAMPPAAVMDPESCYLGFEINFQSDLDKSAIENVFEFVREDSRICILPPHSRISSYLDLIRELPGEEMRLGEILVKCGTLTQTELEEALRSQTDDNSQGVIGEVLVERNLVHQPVVDAALEKQKQVKESRSAENALIRVDAGKLDHLINLVGELIIAGAGTRLIAQQSKFPGLTEATEIMSRLVEEVRDSALMLRMVQIGATFNRFQRVVRDASRELGKEIDLVISGAETELDKTVVEKIGDPLTHLIRNSMDHGIEPAEVRLACGKPSKGTVRLNAHHDSGSIVIEVSDDGGGLNRDRILAKAIERGLVQPDAELGDNEIYHLIFEAGFSTADQVSKLSGRGVGMDVVRRNIQSLRGTIELDSQAGVGTTTRIRLPLTLAIIDGFLVGVGKATYVLPLDRVVECIEVTGAMGKNDYMNLRGEVLPYIRLRELFSMTGQPAKRENVVVVEYAGRRAGLMVDRLMGEFQTVIKPLGKLFGNIGWTGGFTILGNGEVALILDVGGLVNLAAGREGKASAKTAIM